MSNGCSGGAKCACGCPEGNCTCKQAPSNDEIIDFGIGAIIDWLGDKIRPGAGAYFGEYLYGLFTAEVEVIKHFEATYGEHTKAAIKLSELELLYPGTPAYWEAKAELDALEKKLQEMEEAKRLKKKIDESSLKLNGESSTSSVLSQMLSIASSETGESVSASQAKELAKKINSCICEPCGDDTPPKNPIDGEKDKKPYDPLAFDLNNDGTITTINVDDSKVYIDVDNDGLGEKIGWVSGEDGLLFYDKNNNNKFDGLSELFGTASINGFEDLVQYDSNFDGVIDKNDAIYSQLQIWQDLNSDGKVQEGELSSLESRGIEGILLEHDKVHIDNNSNAIIAQGTYIKDGNLHFAGSLNLVFDNSSSKYIGDIAIDPLASILPFMWGFGDVAATNVSLTLDEEFLNIATNKLLDVSVSGGFMDANEFLYYWSGLYKVHEKYGIERNPASLTMGDKMWLIEKFLGSYEYTASIENAYKNKQNDAAFGTITIDTANNKSLYQQLFDYYNTQLLIYSLNTQLVHGISYNITTGLVTIDEKKLETSLMKDYFTINELAFLVGKVKELNIANVGTLFIEHKDSLQYRLLNGNIMLGTDINDNMRGNTSQDNIFIGGKGNDTLNGGGGNDTYVFNRGDGKDTINDASGNSDTIRFTDVNVDDIGIFKSGSTLQVSYGDNDTISIKSGNIERFEFADGSYRLILM